MKLKKVIFIVLFLEIGIVELQAQQSVHTTGGNASGSEGTSSYSIGQVVYTTHTGTNASIAQGVQQPYEISIVSDSTQDVSLKFLAYPNPTTDLLKLKISNYTAGSNLSYQLYDLTGNLLENKKIENSETSIDLKRFISAVYFLKIIEGNKKMIVFKIIKH